MRIENSFRKEILNDDMGLDNSNWIKSFYLPKDCLQGAEFPGHLIWDKNTSAKIRVFLPDGIKVVEMYNVKEDGFTLEDNILDIFEFEVNGYVGFVFKSTKFEESGVTKVFKFLIESESGDTIEREVGVYLFRPEIIINYKPDRITIEADTNKIQISDKIKIINIGEGTAILSLDVSEDSKIVKKRPEDFEEFVTNLWNDLDEKFASLKEDYPEYSDILDEFIAIGKIPVEFTKEYLSKLEDLFKKFAKAFEDNKDFMYDFAEVVITAYIMNLNVITEISSFLEFLKSTVGKKILLIDPMAIFEIPNSTEDLLVDITLTDLANNEYPPLNVSVKLNIRSAEETIRIPMYSLFEFGEEVHPSEC